MGKEGLEPIPKKVAGDFGMLFLSQMSQVHSANTGPHPDTQIITLRAFP